VQHRGHCWASRILQSTAAPSNAARKSPVKAPGVSLLVSVEASSLCPCAATFVVHQAL
jgi:hypothetical protein